ncbi:MAG: ABC transporter substrate-binding protein, partial [Myxococcales bacterium]
NEAQQNAARQKVIGLLDGKVSFTDVAKLAQQMKTSDPLWPAVQYKLARIYAHLRDEARAKEALEVLLAQAPQSPFAAEARTMAERLARGEQVKPRVVGVVLPLSGKYKAIGESALAGIQLALGKDVQLVTRDTGGDVAQARKAVDELVRDEQVIAIIGPVLTNESEDAATEAELLETPIITLTRAEGITERGNFVFRNMLTNSAQAKALVDYAMKVKGFKTFGLLYPNIAYGTELANYFWDAVEARDGEIRAAETYDHDQTTFGPTAKKLVGRYYLDQREDFRAQRREIMESTKDPFRQRKQLEDLRKKLPPIVDFEALFIPDYYKNVGLVAPALAVEDIITNACDKRDLERIAKTTGKDSATQVKTVQLFGGNGWNFEELVERGGKFVQCAIFVDGFFANSDRKETRAFVEAFRKAHGREPVLLEAVAYDTARIVRQIIEKESPQSRAAFREALLRVKDFPGATGKTSFSSTGEVEKPLFFLTIDRGQIRELDSDVKS